MKLWILVADAGNARIFDSDGRHEPLRLLRTLSHERSRTRDADINSDRAGRRGKSLGQHGSGTFALPASVRQHDVEARHFARELAGIIGSAQDRHDFTALALVAPARFLGLITDSLDPQARKRVVHRMDKDLTHVETRNLDAHLAPVFQAAEAEEHRRVWQS
jgi:protein required for attachment to host cells